MGEKNMKEEIIKKDKGKNKKGDKKMMIIWPF